MFYFLRDTLFNVVLSNGKLFMLNSFYSLFKQSTFLDNSLNALFLKEYLGYSTFFLLEIGTNLAEFASKDSENVILLGQQEIKSLK